MIRTDRYRAEHQGLLELAAALEAQLVTSELAHDGALARATLSRLAARLTLHAGTEDRVLYPALQEHPDAAVRAQAQDFARALGGLLADLGAYLARWPTGRAIEERPYAFVLESRSLLLALARRIAAEDGELFPAVDRARAPVAHPA